MKKIIVFYLKSLTFFIVIITLLASCANNKAIESTTTPTANVDITQALERAVNNAFRAVSTDYGIAIVHVDTPNRVYDEYFIGEIEHILVEKGYRMLDRRNLDHVRIEQVFQMSGDVDDNTAISIGRLAGADAIIIGRIDGAGTLQRTRIRVLDTESGQVLGTGSEPFTTLLEFAGTSTRTPAQPIVETSQIINITSVPNNSNVQIYNQDGNVVYTGRTPVNTRLNIIANTSFVAVISRDGYVNSEHTIQVINRKLSPENINANLTRVPPQQEIQTQQTINITSNPTGANVQIFNQAGNVVYAGNTPANPNLNTIANTSFVVVVSRDGYVNYEQTIRVSNNRLQTDRVSAILNRVPAPPVTQTPTTTPTRPVQTPAQSQSTQSPTRTSARVGDIITFGAYRWRVLDVQGSRALIITDDIIERRAYHSSFSFITWANCSLRTYLNGTFYNSFSAADRARIIEVNNVNRSNQWFGTNGGANTNDRIFLLSIEEVVRYFGDSGQLANRPSGSTYFINDQYNSARIARFNGTASFCWLRSPGFSSNTASYVSYDGSLIMLGNFVDDDDPGGVRPALWLNL